MRVLLISPNIERLKMPTLPLGLAHVATAVRQHGHEVLYLDLLGETAPESAIQRAMQSFSPEVVGISIRNIDNQDMQEPVFLLDRVKDLVSVCRAGSAAPIVVGGAGYSIFPAAAMALLGADYGIVGEGEHAFPMLLERLGQRQEVSGIPGLYVPGHGLLKEPHFTANLDGLPVADAALWSSADPADPELWIPIQTRRGCPLSCSYCSTASIEGRAVRMRSVQKVAEHLAKVAAAGFCRFYFVDNTFSLPSSYALELCNAIAARRLGITWRCILYPHNVPDTLVAAMARAGCVEVSLGFESGAVSVLTEMNKRFEPEEVRIISARLAAHGIRRMGFLLLGGPGETKETVEESVAFADSLRLEMLNVTIGIRIYPQTALARIAIEEGMLDRKDNLLHPRFYLRPELETCIRDIVGNRGQ